jgi:Mn2+/Fe2+ NRAMP family transporter
MNAPATLRRFFHSILPGIFLIGFNIGTGSVTAMAKAGANYGMALLWALLLSCLVTFYLIRLFGKYTIVTGETALEAFRKHIHPAVGWFFLIALTVNVGGGIMGVMGIVSDVLHVWSRTWTDGGIPALTWAFLCVALVYGVFLLGSTQSFERAMALMVAVMGVSFAINTVLMMPPLGDILRGLIPRIPENVGSMTGGSYLVVASMVGTTVSSAIFIVRTTLVKEQGWQPGDLSLQARDAGVSALLMFLISGAIMTSAAGTLFLQGVKLDHASEMIPLLEPVAGPFAVSIFVLGITAAGLSSQIPNTLLLPWLICDFFSLKRDMRKRGFRLLVLGMSLLGLVVPLFHGRPVFIMIASQAFASLVLPTTVACIFYLTTKKSIMGGHANRRKDVLLLSLILLFAVFMGAVGFQGFLEDLLS